MLKFNEKVEELKVKYEKSHRAYKHSGNDYQMRICEGSIDLCNDVLNREYDTEKEVVELLDLLEKDALDKWRNQLELENIVYYEGRGQAIALLREVLN